MGHRGDAYRVLVRWEGLRERDYLEDLGVDGRIILKWSFWKLDGGMVCIDLAEDRDRWRFCECSNEPSGFIKYGEFQD
jgi:hypothetical protein